MWISLQGSGAAEEYMMCALSTFMRAFNKQFIHIESAFLTHVPKLKFTLLYAAYYCILIATLHRLGELFHQYVDLSQHYVTNASYLHSHQLQAKTFYISYCCIAFIPIVLFFIHFEDFHPRPSPFSLLSLSQAILLPYSVTVMHR